MRIPVLSTPRLDLVAPDLGAFDTYRRFYTDGEASAFYGGPLSTEQTWARLKADLGSWQLLGFGVWVLRVRDSGEYVGSCGYWQGEAWPRELTWWMLPAARGQGYATEASRAAIAYAYDQCNWPVVESYMNDDNLPARQLVSRLGGTRCRRERFPDGHERDVFALPRIVCGDPAGWKASE